MAPRAYDSGHWATHWKWPAVHAEQVEAAGLHLRDVVCLVDRATGAVVCAPLEAYVQWPGAVPRELLDAAAGKHGGRVLRVVHRVHPSSLPIFRATVPRVGVAVRAVVKWRSAVEHAPRPHRFPRGLVGVRCPSL